MKDVKLEPGGKNEGENSKGNNNSMGSSGLPYPRFYNGTEDFTAYLKNFNRIATATIGLPQDALRYYHFTFVGPPLQFMS